MDEPIRIKPHHFVDILRALGHGQTEFEPHPYGHAVHSVAARLLDDRDSLLEMDLGADDICVPCTHNVDGQCDDTIDTSFRPEAPSSKREYNLLIDRRWLARLELAEGDRLTAREFCERLRRHSGPLDEVYREMQADRVAERTVALATGTERFLAGRTA